MTEKEREIRLEQDLVGLRKAFDSQADIPLPESLYSKNLIHLLPEKPKKKQSNIFEVLISKKLISVYATVVAALLLLAIIPRVTMNENNFITKSDQAGIEQVAEKPLEAAERGEMETAADSLPAGAQAAPQNEPPTLEAAEGEDLSSYFAGENPSTPKTEEPEILEEKQGNTPAETQDNQLDEEAEKESSAGRILEPIPRTSQESSAANQGTEAIDPESSPSTLMSPKQAFGGGGSSFLIDGSWKGHSFAWKPANVQNPDQKDYKIMLTVIDNKTQEIYLEQGFKNLSSISKVAVYEDTVYIVGLNDGITLIEVFTGISSGKLAEKDTHTLQGDFYNVFTKDNFLYVLTIGEVSGENISTNETILMEDSMETKTAIFSVVDLSTGQLTKTLLVGSGENLSIGDVSVTFSYKNASGETESLEVFYNKGITVK